MAGQSAAVSVGVIMGSQSDWETLRHATETLAALDIGFEARIVSAHRTPDRLREYANSARDRGLRVIVAGAGGAAHLPGMAAAWTSLPVLGVPVESHALKGMDSLLSIVQMPAGIPVGTLAIGRAGAINAALLAAAILATADPALAERLDAWRARQTEAVAMPRPLIKLFSTMRARLVRNMSGDGRTGVREASSSSPSALTFSNSKLITSTALAKARRDAGSL